MLSMLEKKSADDILKYFFFFFEEKRLCYFMQITICMKCQSQFTKRNKKKYLKISSTEILPSMQSINSLSKQTTCNVLQLNIVRHIFEMVFSENLSCYV